MAQAVDYKRLTNELGDLLSLSEKIRLFSSGGRKGRAPKNPGATAVAKNQGDKALVRLLKSKYVLNDAERQSILNVVSGKAVVKKVKAAKPQARVLNDAERADLKKEIDALINKVGIEIRVQGLNEKEYLRRVSGNVSIRKSKIISTLNPGRSKKAPAN